MQITIDVPEGAKYEIREALAEAVKYARLQGDDCPLSSKGHVTRRYDWYAASEAIEALVKKI